MFCGIPIFGQCQSVEAGPPRVGLYLLIVREPSLPSHCLEVRGSRIQYRPYFEMARLDCDARPVLCTPLHRCWGQRSSGSNLKQPSGPTWNSTCQIPKFKEHNDLSSPQDPTVKAAKAVKAVKCRAVCAGRCVVRLKQHFMTGLIGVAISIMIEALALRLKRLQRLVLKRWEVATKKGIAVLVQLVEISSEAARRLRRCWCFLMFAEIEKCLLSISQHLCFLAWKDIFYPTSKSYHRSRCY